MLKHNANYGDKMTREYGRKWDGKSRVSNDTYRENWNNIFNKPKKKKLNNVITEEQWVKQMKKKHGIT